MTQIQICSISAAILFQFDIVQQDLCHIVIDIAISKNFFNNLKNYTMKYIKLIIKWLADLEHKIWFKLAVTVTHIVLFFETILVPVLSYSIKNFYV